MKTTTRGLGVVGLVLAYLLCAPQRGFSQQPPPPPAEELLRQPPARDATATDAWGQVSNIATVMVSDTAPVIQNFAVIRGAGNTWTFQGSVVAGYAEGLVVTFGGHSSIAEQTATVGADGTFSVTLTLPPGAYFYASAITTDWWGLDSDPVYYPVG